MKPTIKETTLIDGNGTLFLPNKTILLVRYASGDVDTISTENPNVENLRNALYDAREMGEIPNVPAVYLPCGKEFRIEQK